MSCTCYNGYTFMHDSNFLKDFVSSIFVGKPLCIGQFPWSRIPKSNYISRSRITELRRYEFVPGAFGYNAADTPWLTGDEILTLIANSNPDAPGQHANWISGPAPLAYFYTYFGQTLANPADHGRVKIMVVNTNSDKGFHWFVVAWFIDP